MVAKKFNKVTFLPHLSCKYLDEREKVGAFSILLLLYSSNFCNWVVIVLIYHWKLPLTCYSEWSFYFLFPWSERDCHVQTLWLLGLFWNWSISYLSQYAESRFGCWLEKLGNYLMGYFFHDDILTIIMNPWVKGWREVHFMPVIGFNSFSQNLTDWTDSLYVLLGCHHF